jgi:MOSC domain-containing protein YiiM
VTLRAFRRDIGPVRESYSPMAEILEHLHAVNASPVDNGTLEAIVIRPSENKRESLDSVSLTPEGGLQGDRWSLGCWKKLPDGRPHPDVQVAIMNSSFIQALAGDRELWPIAGDNLYVDLNISEEYLAAGQLLKIGSTVLQITNEPHLGCKKFALRFGVDAVRVVNTKTGRELRLRGVYARILQSGKISVGDKITKIH